VFVTLHFKKMMSRIILDPRAWPSLEQHVTTQSLSSSWHPVCHDKFSHTWTCHWESERVTNSTTSIDDVIARQTEACMEPEDILRDR
jgi:hypothetical protein